jgi:septum formation protein
LIITSENLKNKKIILASESPRRSYLLSGLLKNFGLKFIIKPANIEECIKNENISYGNYVKLLAKKKVDYISKFVDGIILGADTIVVYNKLVIGKPKNIRDAKNTLKMLSGNWHKVYTGIHIFDTSNRTNNFSAVEITKVKFRALLDDEINYYVKSGSPLDKAGSYGIQDDFGCTFVEKIIGDYFNVVGLPLLKTYIGLIKILKVKI